MRQLGTLRTEAEALLFHDYLLGREIVARCDQDEQGWEIWIIEEDDLEPARTAFAAFQANPSDPMFREGAEAFRQRREIRTRQAAREIRERQKAQNPEFTWFPRLDCPITGFLIIASVIVTIAIHFDDNNFGIITDFTIVDYRPAGGDNIRFYPYLNEIREGEVWRLITPCFLHYDQFHLLFNMYWLYILGSTIETRFGYWRYALMFLLIAIFSNLAEYAFKIPEMLLELDPTFGGMSGVDFGFFGYVWLMGKSGFHDDLRLPDLSVGLMLGYLVLCMTGLLGPIANTAHLVGLLSGCGFAQVSLLWEQWRKNSKETPTQSNL